MLGSMIGSSRFVRTPVWRSIVLAAALAGACGSGEPSGATGDAGAAGPGGAGGATAGSGRGGTGLNGGAAGVASAGVDPLAGAGCSARAGGHRGPPRAAG